MQASSAADRPLSGGRPPPPHGPHVRAENAIRPRSACLNRTHSFLTRHTVTFGDSAMILFRVPFFLICCRVLGFGMVQLFTMRAPLPPAWRQRLERRGRRVSAAFREPASVLSCQSGPDCMPTSHPPPIPTFPSGPGADGLPDCRKRTDHIASKKHGMKLFLKVDRVFYIQKWPQ